MAVDVTIQSETFSIPEQNESAGYGEELTDLLVKVADVIGTVAGPNDISTTTDVIYNNKATATSITGLAFSTGAVRSFVVDYVVYRVADSTVMESGKLVGTYDGVSDWYFSDEKLGDAGMFFSITTGGQVQYYSDNMPVTVTAHSGVIKFRATTIDI